MTAAPPARSSRRPTVTQDMVPGLARGTKLRFDDIRQRWVLLVPERVMVPDDTAVEVLQLCDGVRSVTEIVEHLSEKYAAPREDICADVIEMLQDLSSSGFLVAIGGEKS